MSTVGSDGPAARADVTLASTLVERVVREVCGVLLDDLVLAMRDHLTQPFMLPPDNGAGCSQPRLATAYDLCQTPLDQHLSVLDDAGTAEVRGWLPSHLAPAENRHLPGALLEVATSRGYYDLDPETFSSTNPNARLYQSHPDLILDTDGDGLLHVSGYDAQPQVLLHEASAVPYHRFLRRNFAGSVNDALVQTLLEVASSGAADLRLALDEQHLMAVSAFAPYIERDYWWGPRLSPDTLDDPRKVGVSVHADPQTGLLHQYPRLYVAWSWNKEGRKVVQVEELSDDVGASQGGLRLVRYLHAIRDVERGVFVHCDGAVRAYTPQRYASRASKDYLTGRESASRYRKVFRLDGEIPTNAWSNIAARWFRGNTLMTEYLASLSVPGEAHP